MPRPSPQFPPLIVSRRFSEDTHAADPLALKGETGDPREPRLPPADQVRLCRIPGKEPLELLPFVAEGVGVTRFQPEGAPLERAQQLAELVLADRARCHPSTLMRSMTLAGTNTAISSSPRSRSWDSVIPS